MRIFLVTTLFLMLEAMPAAAETHILLRLTQMSDDTPVTQIILSGNSIDPNTRSVEDRFEVTVNGRRAAIPDTVAVALASARRAYSYDTFTRGITERSPLATCMMAGPARGWILETLYLTYDDAGRITASQLRPVLSEAGNCLFSRHIQPDDRDAHVAAAKAMAALRMISDLN